MAPSAARPAALLLLLALASPACRHVGGPNVRHGNDLMLDQHGLPAFSGSAQRCPSSNGEGAIQLAYANGETRLKGTCQGGLMFGAWKAWWDNGALVWKADFEHGRLTGTFKAFHANDEKMAVATFREGRPEGDFTAWWPNGRKRMQGQYVGGRMNGCWESWHENGQVAEKGTYADDKPVLTWLAWTPSGEKSKQTFGGEASHGKCLITF